MFLFCCHSRLSGGSAQSEILSSEKKKKKSIFGKLKKLTKSRSIDDQVDSTGVVDFRPIGTVSQVIKVVIKMFIFKNNITILF